MEESPCCSKEPSMVRSIIILNVYLFIYGYAGSLWLQEGISLVVVSGLLIAGPSVAEHGLSCSEACGIFPDQRSNPGSLVSQAGFTPREALRAIIIVIFQIRKWTRRRLKKLAVKK